MGSAERAPNGGRPRGTYLGFEARQQIALTRQLKACVRCRSKKMRCVPDPQDLSGRCLACLRLQGVSPVTGPCVRSPTVMEPGKVGLERVLDPAGGRSIPPATVTGLPTCRDDDAIRTRLLADFAAAGVSDVDLEGGPKPVNPAYWEAQRRHELEANPNVKSFGRQKSLQGFSTLRSDDVAHNQELLRHDLWNRSNPAPLLYGSDPQFSAGENGFVDADFGMEPIRKISSWLPALHINDQLNPGCNAIGVPTSPMALETYMNYVITKIWHMLYRTESGSVSTRKSRRRSSVPHGARRVQAVQAGQAI